MKFDRFPIAVRRRLLSSHCEQRLNHEAFIILALALDPVLQAQSSVREKARDLEQGLFRFADQDHKASERKFVACRRNDWPRLVRRGLWRFVAHETSFLSPAGCYDQPAAGVVCRKRKSPGRITRGFLISHRIAPVHPWNDDAPARKKIHCSVFRHEAEDLPVRQSAVRS